MSLNLGTESIFQDLEGDDYISVTLTQSDLIRQILLKELEDQWANIKNDLVKMKKFKGYMWYISHMGDYSQLY